MNRINALRTAAQNSVAWGKKRSDTLSTTQTIATNLEAAASPLFFAAVLICCSLAVGCSSQQPKPVTTAQASEPTVMPPVSAPATPPTSTQTASADTPTHKPLHKKVTRKAPPTLTYTDPTTGVSFQYPPKDSLKTSTAATDLVASTTTPMDFIMPGGTVVAAVALPPTAYPDSNLASAFFNVSVNKSLTADQCSEFSVPAPNPADPTIQATAQVTAGPVTKSKLMIGDLELQSSEPTASQTTTPTQQTAKYFHVFQNQACYEFALQVATNQVDSSTKSKTVDPEKVLQSLEKILATVKINPESVEAKAPLAGPVPNVPEASPAQ